MSRYSSKLKSAILSIILRKVLPTNVILQLICKRREDRPVFKAYFIDVQIKLFEDILSQGGRRIVADGGLNGVSLVLQIQV